MKKNEDGVQEEEDLKRSSSDQDFLDLVEVERENPIPASFRAGEERRKGNLKRALQLEKVAAFIRVEMREARGYTQVCKPQAQNNDRIRPPVSRIR